MQRGKAFWFHRRDKSCSDQNKPFSLPTDQTFLFLTEETLSGSPKETRPVLIRTNLLLFPQTKPFFSSQKKRFLVPPKLGTLTCGSVLCLTLVRRLQDKPTHGQKYTHNRMRKKKQGPVGEAPRPPPWTAKGTEPHPVPQRNADVGRPSRPQAGPAVIHAPQPTPHKRSAPR